MANFSALCCKLNSEDLPSRRWLSNHTHLLFTTQTILIGHKWDFPWRMFSFFILYFCSIWQWIISQPFSWLLWFCTPAFFPLWAFHISNLCLLPILIYLFSKVLFSGTSPYWILWHLTTFMWDWLPYLRARVKCFKNLEFVVTNASQTIKLPHWADF